jgi:predicted Fe-Mo cluster-binding NifX family protein
MRIAIPTNDNKGLKSRIAEHFGKCKTYTMLDENGKLIEIIDNTSEHMGGTGLPPELIKKNRGDILLCRGLGPRAIELCGELGVKVYVCKAETVNEIFKVWKENKIKQAGLNDVCEEHKR